MDSDNLFTEEEINQMSDERVEMLVRHLEIQYEVLRQGIGNTPSKRISTETAPGEIMTAEMTSLRKERIRLLQPAILVLREALVGNDLMDNHIAMLLAIKKHLLEANAETEKVNGSIRREITKVKEDISKLSDRLVKLQE